MFTIRKIDRPESDAQENDLAIIEIDASKLDLDGLNRLGATPLVREKNHESANLPSTALEDC
jgi:hypothetical protein